MFLWADKLHPELTDFSNYTFKNISNENNCLFIDAKALNILDINKEQMFHDPGAIFYNRQVRSMIFRKVKESGSFVNQVKIYGEGPLPILIEFSMEYHNGLYKNSFKCLTKEQQKSVNIFADYNNNIITIERTYLESEGEITEQYLPIAHLLTQMTNPVVISYIKNPEDIDFMALNTLAISFKKTKAFLENSQIPKPIAYILVIDPDFFTQHYFTASVNAGIYYQYAKNMADAVLISKAIRSEKYKTIPFSRQSAI